MEPFLSHYGQEVFLYNCSSWNSWNQFPINAYFAFLWLLFWLQLLLALAAFVLAVFACDFLLFFFLRLFFFYFFISLRVLLICSHFFFHGFNWLFYRNFLFLGASEGWGGSGCTFCTSSTIGGSNEMFEPKNLGIPNSIFLSEHF